MMCTDILAAETVEIKGDIK